MLKSQPFTKETIVSRSPIFYGWIIWGVATLGSIATAPAQSFTVSLFIDSFIADFNLDRTTVSTLYSLGTLVAAFSLTWIGRQIDRYGNRRMGVFIAAFFVVTLLLFSLINGPLMLLIGFVALRGSGQGSLWLVNNTAIANWFMRYRGRVTSLTLVSFALFQSVYVPWLGRLLETTDWRQVYVMLAGVVAVVTIPITLLLMRNRPEDYGLQPDGAFFNVKHKAKPDQKETEAVAVNEDNWSLHEVMRLPLFWIFLCGRILSPAWGTGLIFHQISIFETLGHTGTTAADTYAVFALLSAATSLISGILIDRVRPGRAMSLQLSGLILAMFMAMVMTEVWMLLIYALGFGFVMGIAGVFDGAVWANLFGRKHQGAIRGFVTTSIVAGTAIGPVLFGLSFDLTGSYNAVLLLGIMLAVVPMTLSLFLDKPERRGTVEG